LISNPWWWRWPNGGTKRRPGRVFWNEELKRRRVHSHYNFVVVMDRHLTYTIKGVVGLKEESET
jgi:hypothetical protein